MKSQLQRCQQVQVVGELHILDELHQHFRVRVAAEGDAFLLKPFLQRGIVFDNTVMDKSQIARRGIMRMGIDLGRFAVGRPARVGDSDISGNVFVFYKMFQIGNASLRLIYVQLILMVD